MPQRDPILSFSHTFLPKSTHVEGRRPPMGNPGSAAGYVTLNFVFLKRNMFFICTYPVRCLPVGFSAKKRMDRHMSNQQSVSYRGQGSS